MFICNRWYRGSNTGMTGFLLIFWDIFIELLFSIPFLTTDANPAFSTFGFPYLLRAAHFHSQRSRDTNNKLDLSSNYKQTNKKKHFPSQRFYVKLWKWEEHCDSSEGNLVRTIPQKCYCNYITDIWKYGFWIL